MNFFGHAGLDLLAAVVPEGAMVTTGDIEEMAPSTGQPAVTAMTCMVGQFAVPGYDSLAEVLLLKEGAGAAAVWSPAGLSVNAEARLLDEEFYRAFAAGESVTIGEVINTAFRRFRAEGGDADLLRSYNLLGDPAMRLR